LLADVKVAVLINGRAGSIAGENDSATRQVLDAFVRQGVEVELHSPTPAMLPTVARSLSTAKFDAVAAGGGDGTISSVAEVLAGGSMPLGVLPLGTRNNFARDIGIPLEVEGAAQVIAQQHISRIDVAEVNGRLFINNSSIGAYPHVVREREQDRKRYGIPKWLAMIAATLKVFRRHPLLRVRIELDGKVFLRRTPFLFVGNNLYGVNLFEVKFRSCLTEGKLCVYSANCTGFLCLAHLFWLALCNRLDQTQNFEMHTGSELLVYPGRRRISVAKDGEVLKLETPLSYRLHRAALPVLTPMNE
jgi:diacylglycerol kinase family enzyme